jgi:thiol:disulfide interchange protein DsbC
MTCIQVVSVQKRHASAPASPDVQRADGIRIYYTDAKAEVILAGANLIETRTERSLTEERLRKLSAIDWNALPFAWAITTRRGDGQRQIAIFSDPNCPYCRKFERDLATVGDITVHIFPYAVIKPESVRQTKSVWSSKDRAKAWNDLMLKDIEPTAPTKCDNPIDELVALGRKFGATSTPTWFLRNEEKHQGALPINALLPLLDAASERAK